MAAPRWKAWTSTAQTYAAPTRTCTQRSSASIGSRRRSIWPSSAKTPPRTTTRKQYLSLLGLFLDKSPDESMDDFEERFKARAAAEARAKEDKKKPAQDQEQPAP